ncbi:MAG: CRR6 family NdhI maturation factor [Cyanobacteria bacterium P01_F01_bin.150]
MTTTISLNAETLARLDISSVQQCIEELQAKGKISQLDETIRFEIDYPKEPTDPRELSEIPEIRLWFIRLNVSYPWLPFILDWESGELARYTAMLVPHQFSFSDGIQYNPEALEIFVMEKIFVISEWMQREGTPRRQRLKLMTKSLGYEIDDAFFDLIEFKA